MAALERHAVELLAAGDFDLEPRGQRVHHRDADAVQAAGGLVNLGVEFATGMQRAHDDFERGFFWKFRMRIDRNAASIVGDGEESVGAQLHFDEGGMARQRLVHGVVDDFGEQMVQRLLVGAADIHAGPAAYRLEPFEHLDIGCGVAGFGACRARRGFERGAAFRLRGAEQVVRCFWFHVGFQWFGHVSSYVARAWERRESVSLTMPRMSSKSDRARRWRRHRPTRPGGPSRNKEHTTDQVEMGMRGPEREVLLDTHDG